MVLTSDDLSSDVRAPRSNQERVLKPFPVRTIDPEMVAPLPV